MTTHTDNFVVTRRTLGTPLTCKPGPLGNNISLITLNFFRASGAQATSGPINKKAPSANIVLSQAEFVAVWNAVALATLTNPVTLRVTYDDSEVDPRLADVTSVVPVPQLAALVSIQADVSAISATTESINQKLDEGLTASVAELQKLNKLVRLGLLRLGVPESEIPLMAASAPQTYETEPPTSDAPMQSESDPPPALDGLPHNPFTPQH